MKPSGNHQESIIQYYQKLAATSSRKPVKFRLSRHQKAKARFLLKKVVNSIRYIIWKAFPQGSRIDRWIGRSLLAIKRAMTNTRRGKKEITGDELAARYQKWVQKNAPGFDLLYQQSLNCNKNYPTVRFLLLMKESSDLVLTQETISSLQTQTCTSFRVTLVVSESSSTGIEQARELFASDDRIQIFAGKTDLATAWAAMPSDWVVCLNAGDTLSPDYLFELFELIRSNPTLELIYTDSDQRSPSGEREKPWLKPGLCTQAMLFSANYYAHAAVKSDLIERAGGYEPIYGDAEEWRLMLRCAAGTAVAGHIPRILIHAYAGKTAALGTTKPQLQAALADILNSDGHLGARVDFIRGELPHVSWQIQHPLVSIIIPTKNNCAMLQACLASITQKTAYQNYEIILVDNGSTDADVLAYYRELQRQPSISIINYAQSFNYSRAINFGARQARGDCFLFLNNDIEVIEPNWLDEMAQWALEPNTGVVGAKLLYPDRTVQHAGVVIGLSGFVNHIYNGAPEHADSVFGSVDWYRNYSAVTGACQMARREVFERLGGYDERYQLVFSDVDFCIRARKANYQVFYTPFAVLLHKESATRGQGDPIQDIRRAEVLLRSLKPGGDPHYNPTLSESVWPDLE